MTNTQDRTEIHCRGNSDFFQPTARADSCSMARTEKHKLGTESDWEDWSMILMELAVLFFSSNGRFLRSSWWFQGHV